MIALLGTGLLGSGFARALHARGEHLRVWNRTPAKARALEAAGISVAPDPAAAVREVERVHLVLGDDASVDEVLAAAAASLAPGTLVVDHSTTSPGGALARTEAWRGRGIAYLHAPVFMGPQNAREATGVMLVSGDRAVVARAAPLLAPMTGKLVDLGPRVDAAAAYKLLGNLLLMAFTAGFTDMLALGKAMGLPPAEVATLFDFFNPGAMLPARFARLRAGAYDEPSWELAMARKDARLMQEEAARAGLPLTMLPALVARMDAAIAAGDAHADWTVIARDLLR